LLCSTTLENSDELKEEECKRAKNDKVLPGIEPGLPEDTELIRIRSDNRYLRGELAGAREKCCSKNLHYKTE
jgi:hypothetical protein